MAMLKYYYVLKIDSEYWNGWGTTRKPRSAYTFDSSAQCTDYINTHAFELNGQKPKIVKIKDLVEEVEE